jgi:hypothetical protein
LLLLLLLRRRKRLQLVHLQHGKRIVFGRHQQHAILRVNKHPARPFARNFDLSTP